MATTPRKLLKQLLEIHGPLIERAFLQAVSTAVNSASVKLISDALSRGDYDQALDILGITPEAFDTVAESIDSAYRASGRGIGQWISGVSEADIQFQFKVGNPVAAAWLQHKSSTFVTEIGEAQRAAVREALASGMERGLNPRTVALDIAGRRLKGQNQRTGGIVGLTKRQTRTVLKIKSDFESADLDAMRAYLRLKLRDRRFDGKVRRAIKSGKPLSREDINRIAGRYSDKALKWRADNIARTEATQAFHAAQDHAFGQAIESGHVEPQNVVKTWISARDDRVRFSHSVLNGQQTSHEGVFVSPIGSMMKHPGDRSLGASADDTAQCRCRLTYTVQQPASEQTPEEYVPAVKQELGKRSETALSGLKNTMRSRLRSNDQDVEDMDRFFRHVAVAGHKFAIDKGLVKSASDLNKNPILDDRLSFAILRAEGTVKSTRLGIGTDIDAIDAAAINLWTHNGNDWLQHGLRTAPKNASVKAFQKVSDRAFKRWNSAPGSEEIPVRSGNLWRGSAFKQDGLKVGDTFKPREFFATSIDDRVATAFGKNVIYRVSGARGRDLQKISNYADEKELVLPSDVKFKILSIRGSYVELEVIDQ